MSTNDFTNTLHTLGGNSVGGVATVFRMIGGSEKDSARNLVMMIELHAKGISGTSFYLIHKDGCDGNSAKCSAVMEKILSGEIDMTNLKIALLKEDRELLQDLFKGVAYDRTIDSV